MTRLNITIRLTRGTISKIALGEPVRLPIEGDGTLTLRLTTHSPPVDDALDHHGFEFVQAYSGHGQLAVLYKDADGYWLAKGTTDVAPSDTTENVARRLAGVVATEIHRQAAARGKE